MARKILLADDSVTAQNMGRKILADAGYEVITVNNGSAALKRVAEVKPDLIVLDVYMPGYSGLEVCARLKEAGETSRIPILLTVGKLEPFKPEEAKRARADAFIVKPFEASELLSALSKLEDRIVPRPEATKPGRFARAIAAVEEGRYDSAVAGEEDSGWKNRISFPAKKRKKEAADEADVDDPAIYNPVNKDLRTVVERPAEHKPQEGKEPEPSIDLAALAPLGLPKDVTPEEIAALAAAAAQIKGTTAASQGTESRLAEDQAARPAAEPPVAAQQEAKTEEQPEAKKEEPPVAAQPPREAITASQEVEAVAEKKAEEPVQASAEKPSDAAQETPAPGPASPLPDDVMAAIAALPPVAYVAPDAGSGNGAGAHAREGEPVTTAAAAGAEFGATSHRWFAIPVPVLPEEAAISLEQEMHKAYAALAAAEAAHAASVPVIPETQVGFVEPAPATEISSAVEAAVAQPAVPVPTPSVAEQAESVGALPSEAADAMRPAVREREAAAAYVKETTPAPAEAETAGAVAGEAGDAVRPAVKEFEKVVASRAEEKIPASAEPEPAPVETAEAAAAPALEAPLPVEAKAEPIPVVQEAAPEPQAAIPQDALPPAAREPEAEQKQEAPRLPAEAAAAAPAEISSRAEVPETAAPVAASEVAAEPALASQIPPQAAEASAPAEPAAGGTEDMANKEKEIAATTAAAWASWRRIRESGSPKAKPSAEPAKKEVEEEAPAPQDQGKGEAAMAVAAGAEKAPEDVPAESGSESAEIASIVDSVLADLRPKIVEEISRKLGKKKKK